jgi:membrane associated rhomboid family serine protease
LDPADPLDPAAPADRSVPSVPLERRREPLLNVPSVVVALLVLLGAVHAVREWLLPDDIDRVLVWSLAFVPARYDSSALTDGILPGGPGAEIWSFFTYALLHADWTHFGFNAIWLLAFASPVARRFGALRFLLFFAVTIAAGAAAYLIAHAGALAPMIGASAGISGMMGAAARFVFEPGGSLDMWRRNRDNTDHVPAAPLFVALRNPRVVTFVGVWFGLNLLFGLISVPFLAGENQTVAWEAHVGGFLAGLLLFSLFDPVQPASPVGNVSHSE